MFILTRYLITEVYSSKFPHLGKVISDSLLIGFLQPLTSNRERGNPLKF